MLIKQLSVFLENRAGRTSQVTQILADAGIDIFAFSTADRAEFGVLRLVVSDTSHAAEVIKAAGFAVVVTDVVSVKCPNQRGSLARLMSIMAKHGVSAEYVYAYVDGETTNAIIHPSDTQACLAAFEENGL